MDVTDGSILTDRTVLVQGNRIVAVGPADRIDIPERADVVEGTGGYLVPGLWDVHLHSATAAGALFAACPVSIAALVLSQTGDDAAADRLRLALTVGCTFLLAGTALALTLVPLSVRVWRERCWSASRRIYFYVLAAGVAVAAPLLFHYHLLGYWF